MGGGKELAGGRDLRKRFHISISNKPPDFPRAVLPRSPSSEPTPRSHKLLDKYRNAVANVLLPTQPDTGRPSASGNTRRTTLSCPRPHIPQLTLTPVLSVDRIDSVRYENPSEV